MIQIILPPQKMGGVYDFACELREAIGRDTVRLVHLSEAIVSEWEISRGDVVILQMSGYGFAKRGAPFWLLRELEQRRNRIRSLAVFFHELYAIGPPWTSSFWLSPFQRHVARRLAELSDFWITNREGSAQWLRRFAADKPHAVLPVFSNVGESASPATVRAPRIVVFGSAGLRQKTYQAAGRELFAWAKRASLEIHDIGPPITAAGFSTALHSMGVIQHGALDGNDVDLLMREALYGVVAYPVEYAAKSGVFAAYAAHGICPLLISENYAQADGLVAGRHYQPGVLSAEDHLKATSIGRAAWDWYQPHRVSRHSDVVKEFLAQLGAK